MAMIVQPTMTTNRKTTRPTQIINREAGRILPEPAIRSPLHPQRSVIIVANESLAVDLTNKYQPNGSIQAPRTKLLPITKCVHQKLTLQHRRHAWKANTIIGSAMHNFLSLEMLSVITPLLILFHRYYLQPHSIYLYVCSIFCSKYIRLVEQQWLKKAVVSNQLTVDSSDWQKIASANFCWVRDCHRKRILICCDCFL